MPAGTKSHSVTLSPKREGNLQGAGVCGCVALCVYVYKWTSLFYFWLDFPIFMSSEDKYK